MAFKAAREKLQAFTCKDQNHKFLKRNKGRQKTIKLHLLG